MLLKACFQKCQYSARSVTNTKRDTKGLIQKTNMAMVIGDHCYQFSDMAAGHFVFVLKPCNIEKRGTHKSYNHLPRGPSVPSVPPIVRFIHGVCVCVCVWYSRIMRMDWNTWILHQPNFNLETIPCHGPKPKQTSSRNNQRYIATDWTSVHPGFLQLIYPSDFPIYLKTFYLFENVSNNFDNRQTSGSVRFPSIEMA